MPGFARREVCRARGRFRCAGGDPGAVRPGAAIGIAALWGVAAGLLGSMAARILATTR
ncbi:hypothetical protein ACFV3E_34005 [Streptomyces sp. NPDC059718]